MPWFSLAGLRGRVRFRRGGRSLFPPRRSVRSVLLEQGVDLVVGLLQGGGRVALAEHRGLDGVLDDLADLVAVLGDRQEEGAPGGLRLVDEWLDVAALALVGGEGLVTGRLDGREHRRVAADDVLAAGGGEELDPLPGLVLVLGAGPDRVGQAVDRRLAALRPGRQRRERELRLGPF